jgi:hypothetical protein
LVSSHGGGADDNTVCSTKLHSDAILLCADSAQLQMAKQISNNAPQKNSSHIKRHGVDSQGRL